MQPTMRAVPLRKRVLLATCCIYIAASVAAIVPPPTLDVRIVWTKTERGATACQR